MKNRQLVDIDNQKKIVDEIKNTIVIKEIYNELSNYRYTTLHLSILSSHLLAKTFDNNANNAISFLKNYDDMILKIGEELDI